MFYVTLKSMLNLTLALLLVNCAASKKPILRPVNNPTPTIAAGVYESSQVSVTPLRKSRTRRTEPEYPPELQNAAMKGNAVILLTVTKKGNVTDAMVLRAADFRFGDAALKAALQWKFFPAQLNGSAVNCRIPIPVNFKILR